MNLRRNYFTTYIDASKCTDLKGLYKQFSVAFNFPEYKGTEYNEVLNDYISDLGWIEVKNYKLIIRNIKKFEKLNNNQKRLLYDKLDYIREHWSWKKELFENNLENDFLIEIE